LEGDVPVPFPVFEFDLTPPLGVKAAPISMLDGGETGAPLESFLLGLPTGLVRIDFPARIAWIVSSLS
jgi:hypothetical protein